MSDSETLEARIVALAARDEQFAAARPDSDITARIADPAMRLGELLETVLTGYADRPALAARVISPVTDPGTGRIEGRVGSDFVTITYRELHRRIVSAALGLRSRGDGGMAAGDRVAMLGFTGVDFTVLDLACLRLGVVPVPLQVGGAVGQLQAILEETAPKVLAASVDELASAVELVRSTSSITCLVVFDYLPELDAHREALTAAAKALADSGSAVELETLATLSDNHVGGSVADPAPAASGDDLALLIYTSGSTGAPKGAMFGERLIATMFSGILGSDRDLFPLITLNLLPMSHVMGRGSLYGTLGRGGTAYFAAKSDLSTFLDDLAAVHPTQLALVPRLWELLYRQYLREVAEFGPNITAAQRESVLAGLRSRVIGERVLWAISASASLSDELREFTSELLGAPVNDVYGSTEAGLILVNGQLRRPIVREYKLVDVPELGYHRSDRPYPRGELLVKTDTLFRGYYHRPDVLAEVIDADGFYRTGDIVAESGPDQLRLVDRRNNVLKLSQGEFVTVARLEAIYSGATAIGQIYLYGNSSRPFLLAVIVPTEAAYEQVAGDTGTLHELLERALRKVASDNDLQSFEIPRDFLIETTPFTTKNGLLTGVAKLARPGLRKRYGDRLEDLYRRIDVAQEEELRALREHAADRPTTETVIRAAAAVLGVDSFGITLDARFTDLGGDSLSALTFGTMLRDLTGVEVPVGVVVNPAANLRAVSDYIDSGATRPTVETVHGHGVTEIHARDLTLDKFIDAATLAAVASTPHTQGPVCTVLLTGATGFLGRFVALEWLQRLALIDGTLICLVRASDDSSARLRLDEVFDSGDPNLTARYEHLAEHHLEVLAGDKSEAGLGLDRVTWQRLADTVDLVVDVAALVNHVLPYDQLFGPNVVGTAELIRLAMTGRIKKFDYISTVGVGDGIAPDRFDEDTDIRQMSPTRPLSDGYANGYGNSKWAGEVLLREAHDLSGMPVSVFRCDLIMVDGRYVGQLNVPDMFTRLMLSVLATGIAPGSFYDVAGHRPEAHYDGLPVDFIATAIAELGVREGYSTYHVLNPHRDHRGLDEFVDWLVDAGNPIERIDDYENWFQRFGTALRALPDTQRKNSVLPLLHSYTHPQHALAGGIAPVPRFRAAVRAAAVGPDGDIPHITPEMIVKYSTNLRHLHLL